MQVFSSELCEFFKNAFFTEYLWTTAFVIGTVECGILLKDFLKTLQIGLYSAFLNTYKKRENKFDCKRKRTFFYFNYSSIATLKNKVNKFLCHLCFLSLYLFWLTACSFVFFYLRIHVTIMN